MDAGLQEFANNLKNYHSSDWDGFPDIDLYMDQVVTYLERQLGIFGGDPESKVVTSNMINNYVKEGFINRPVNKKYTREHLVNLYVLLLLKPVMPISVLAAGLKVIEKNGSLEDLYSRFGKMQEASFRKIADRLLEEDSRLSGDPDAMRLLAFQLTTEANALRMAAEKLLGGFDTVTANADAAKTPSEAKV